MTSRYLRAWAVLGLMAALLDCGGNAFRGSDDDDDDNEPSQPTGGRANQAGTTGKGEAGAAEGGEVSSSGGKSTGSGGSSAGTSASQGGTSTGEGGTSPGTAGGDDGSAGEGSEPTLPIYTTLKVIDNMEDGNATLLETNGDWFVFKDETAGTITPPKDQAFKMTTLSPVRAESKKAASVTVSGFTDWGAAFGFDFSYVAGIRQPTDLKDAQGVRFWAKASKATTLRFQLPNADTDTLGGKCNGTGANACGAHWTKAFAVGTVWKETTIAFADLAQDLAGRHVASFDKQHVYSSFFVIGPNESVTIWVDDILLVH